MQDLFTSFSLQVNNRVYIKNPESSALGRKIVESSINLIDKVGYEAFTFRKLGLEIHSNEASIYRFFESKYKLLLYLTSWYWSWMEYKIDFGLENIPVPEESLEKAIDLLTEDIQLDGSFEHINEYKLNRIVIAEASKSYMTKEVDQNNKEGFFSGYKQLVGRVSNIILEINPTYKYPHMLISTLIEGAHHQRFFAQHLPRLTDEVNGEDAIIEFSKEAAFKAIGAITPSK